MATWREEVEQALLSIGGQGPLGEIYRAVQQGTTRSLPPSWQAIVRRELEYNSSDSESYQGRFDLFYSVDGIGAGIWGLRSTEQQTPVASDIEPPPRIKAEVYRVLRDTAMVRRLKHLHKNTCQVCGTVIQLRDGTAYSEGHHLKPLGGPHLGPDVPSNILVLCPNHHVLMDYGAIRITDQMLNTNKGHVVGAEFIDYHNKKICGS